MCLSFFKSNNNNNNGNNNSQPAPQPKADPNTAVFTFSSIPSSLAEFTSLPEARLDTPFKAAALTVLALAAYPSNKDAALEMLDFLRGPRPMSNMDKSFIRDRFMDNGKYIPFSYFEGATPANDYTPNQPLTLTVKADAHSYDNQGYARLNLRSGGADSPRQISLRQKSDGTWCLWDQFVMVGIREPKSQNPWA